MASGNTQQLLHRAMAYHQSGKLIEARSLYRKVLDKLPLHADALHLMGVTYMQQKEFQKGIPSIQRAITLKPEHADAHNNLGIAYSELKRFDEAILCFKKSLSLLPRQPEALNNLGNAYSELKRFDEAVICYQQALDIDPDSADAHNHLGNILHEQQRFDDAITYYRRVLSLNPYSAEAYNNLGIAYSQLKQFDDALSAYQQCLAIKPSYADAQYNQGVALSELGRLNEAASAYQHALTLKPGDMKILNNLGNTLGYLKRFPEALDCHRQVLSIQPKDIETLNNMGVALHNILQFEDAITTYKKALAIKPDYGVAWNNLGNTFKELGRFDHAINAYQTALSIDAGYIEAKGNCSLVYLVLGEFEKGWLAYEARFYGGDTVPLSSTPYPRWLGDIPISGKKLLIQMEQGFGDAIQMVRYLPMLLDQGIDCYVQTPEPMMALMARSFPDVHFVDHKTTPDGMDLTIPIMSLPLAMKTFSEADIPSSAAYLVANVERVNYWQGALASSFRHRVGLVWRGNPNHSNDHHRSMPLAACLPLIINHSSIQFVTLQKDLTHEERELLSLHANVRMLDAELKDFDESAAVMMNLAAVISVDSAPAHLAAALGRPTWIPLCFRGEWRWLIDRDDSPWYPSATLFRQLAINDWAHVIQRLSLQLQRLG